MPHDVFISYSSHDKAVADAACAVLEAQKIRCWIAPRDVLPGTEYGEALVNAIGSCRIVVLILSAHSNESPQVRREIERAVSKGKIILPFRIEDVVPSGAMEYCLGNTHWLDALTPPVEAHLSRLAESVASLLRLEESGGSKRAGERWLVYVSSGGTCRDPMAKAITLKLLEQKPAGFDLQVKAFALGPPSKTQASYGARQAITKMYGEDLLARHRPAQITTGITEDADLILVMDHSLLNLKVLPEKKTFVLKSFCGLDGDVEDPWPDGSDDRATARYGRCAAELKEILETNFDKLIDFLRPR
jgi:protein-tyrosine-phosphatase